MALPVTIPNEFANATASIPLSQLDTNFTTLANAVNGISSGSETLANVTATVVNATTVDTTNIEVTNIKAKDGTAAGSIADSTGVVTLASSVLTTTDINGGTIDGTAIGGSTPAAGSFTTLNTSGAVVFNDAGADVDFRVEGDTNANLLFVDASADAVGIGTNAPVGLLDVVSSGSGLIRMRSSTGAGTVGFQAQNSDTGTTAADGAFYGIDGSDQAYVFNYENTPLIFGTNNAERMRITSAGEVLVGGTTEIASLPALTIQRTDNIASLYIFRNDTSIGNGNILGSIAFYGNDTTSNTPTNLAYISAVASGTHAAGDNPTDLVFGCTNDGSETVEEFARLAQDGASGREFEIKQATLANSAASYFKASGGTAGTLNRAAQVGVYKHSGITNSAGFLSVAAEDGIDNYIWADNSDILRISTTIANIGTTGGTVVGAQTSDERLKNISGPVLYGLNEVLAIEPIAFTMKNDPSIAKIGFSAQQVQPIVPEAVYDTKECIDGYTENEETKEQIANSDRTKLSMEYTQLIPVLVNAVKELKAINDAQASRIETLEARITALEAQ